MEQQVAAEAGGTFWLGLYWIGITLAGILSLFGVKKVVELFFADWIVRRKEKAAVHDTNSAARITADVTLTKSLIDRITKLEAGQEQLQSKLADALAKVARLEEKNANLAERNATLEQENLERRQSMHALRNELAGRDLKILELQHSLIDTRKELQALKAEFHGGSGYGSDSNSGDLLDIHKTADPSEGQ